ncbi:MAG: GNAT family N-acetyltransferase [Candidatus Methanofastidiosia archaeon]
MRIKYKIIESEEELEKSRKLRHRVFVEEQGVVEDLERDLLDDKSIHVIAILNQKVIGTGRLTLQSDKAKISRVAVEKIYRGEGIGKKIMDKLEKIAKTKNVKEIYLSSNLQSIQFYCGIGYVEVGKTFIECGVECQKMVKKVIS